MLQLELANMFYFLQVTPISPSLPSTYIYYSVDWASKVNKRNKSIRNLTANLFFNLFILGEAKKNIFSTDMSIKFQPPPPPLTENFYIH